MLALAVATQVHLTLEGLLAQPAREWLVASVLPHMGDEVRRLREGLAADGTLVRLLTCGGRNIRIRRRSDRGQTEVRGHTGVRRTSGVESHTM